MSCPNTSSILTFLQDTVIYKQQQILLLGSKKVMKAEEAVITKRKQEDKKKSDSEQKKAELVRDLVSYVKSGDTIEYKGQLQKLYWEHRKKGLKSKEAWEQAKRDIARLNIS